ncbi:putative disease resistance RPP13-like protein 1 [Neltuma alba]|uniref:putative disease resistance RPP13-like protein 1 n=1 Tax=Neltuma alba TaxID=207710 RepID=UPI0010A38045|nr:putative disease resistance RPP13-like protein 1 [Prosopis alba]
MKLVAGALLDPIFGVLFSRLASPEVIALFRSRKLNDKLLKRLKMKLLSARGVLDDAEGKQIRNSAVKEWLEELKDAAYDADDLLDDIETEAKFRSNEALDGHRKRPQLLWRKNPRPMVGMVLRRPLLNCCCLTT